MTKEVGKLFCIRTEIAHCEEMEGKNEKKIRHGRRKLDLEVECLLLRTQMSLETPTGIKMEKKFTQANTYIKLEELGNLKKQNKTKSLQRNRKPQKEHGLEQMSQRGESLRGTEDKQLLCWNGVLWCWYRPRNRKTSRAFVGHMGLK